MVEVAGSILAETTREYFMAKFESCLVSGGRAERWALVMVKETSRWPVLNVAHPTVSQRKFWDFAVEFDVEGTSRWVKFEVKNDSRYWRGGNLSVEYVQEKDLGAGQYKWSGLAATTAHVWMNISKDSLAHRLVWFTWTPLLRRRLFYPGWKQMDETRRDNIQNLSMKGVYWSFKTDNHKVSGHNPRTWSLMLNVENTVKGKRWGMACRCAKGSVRRFSRMVDWTQWAEGCGT